MSRALCCRPGGLQGLPAGGGCRAQGSARGGGGKACCGRCSGRRRFLPGAQRAGHARALAHHDTGWVQRSVGLLLRCCLGTSPGSHCQPGAWLHRRPNDCSCSATGNILSWRKKEGDEVAAGDVFAEVETDKVRCARCALDPSKGVQHSWLPRSSIEVHELPVHLNGRPCTAWRLCQAGCAPCGTRPAYADCAHPACLPICLCPPGSAGHHRVGIPGGRGACQDSGAGGQQGGGGGHAGDGASGGEGKWRTLRCAVLRCACAHGTLCNARA